MLDAISSNLHNENATEANQVAQEFDAGFMIRKERIESLNGQKLIDLKSISRI